VFSVRAVGRRLVGSIRCRVGASRKTSFKTSLHASGGLDAVAKRLRYSRWRRLPGVYRAGEEQGFKPGMEPRRLTIYLPDALLEQAETQASRAGVETVQQYCADLLLRALEAERVRERVADLESRRGPLEGLHAIADDPEYLAEWCAQAGARDGFEPVPSPPPILPPPDAEPAPDAEPVPEGGPEPGSGRDDDGLVPVPIAAPIAALEPEIGPASTIAHPLVATEATTGPISPAAAAILRHAGQGEDDPRAFLPSLRRGEAVVLDEVAELAQGLRALEAEYRHARVLDRRVAFALHRLAFEAQVLHTDAWPGLFDAWTVDTLHAVQEAVERILSGQDIRYFGADPPPEDLR
jgi:hypothetical protein